MDYDVPWESLRVYCLRQGCGHHEAVHDLNGCRGHMSQCKCTSFIQPTDEVLKALHDQKRRDKP